MISRLYETICLLEMFFIISIVPLYCIGSGIYRNLETRNLTNTVAASAAEAFASGLLIILLSIIREPLGFLSLSLPGGTQGVIMFFSFKTESFLPLRLAASSSGALLLIGYILGLYRYFSRSGIKKG